MWFSSWLRNGKRSATTTRPRPPMSPRRRAAFRPQLEALEDRCVPSTLTVTNTDFGGHGSLRYEIAAAQSGDTIVFNFGKKVTGSIIHTFYTNNKGFYQWAELYINKNLTIEDPSGGVIIDGGGLSRVFEVAAGAQVKLSGLTIVDGGNYTNMLTALQYGGGILNHGVLTLTDCHVENNQAEYGGGIYNDGTLTVSGGDVSDNYAIRDQVDAVFGNDGYGAGIYNAGTASISSCDLESNSAFSAGGGIYNGGTMTVSNCTFDYYQHLNNVSVPQPNGPDDISSSGTLTVSNSAFYYHSSSTGAIDGLYTDGGGNTFIA